MSMLMSIDVMLCGKVMFSVVILSPFCGCSVTAKVTEVLVLLVIVTDAVLADSQNEITVRGEISKSSAIDLRDNDTLRPLNFCATAVSGSKHKS